MSEDPSIQHAVSEEDMKFQDGTLPAILDIVRIKCKEECPSYYQPENCTLDNEYYWTKVGRASLQDVLRLHPPSNKELIFYNPDKAVDDLEIAAMRPCDVYSLIFIVKL